MSLVGRNEPCPCGSGKKWKKCHGDPARVAEPSTELRALLEELELDQDTTIESLSTSLRGLIQELRVFDPIQVITGACGLALISSNHSLIFRIDVLIYLAALHCVGAHGPTTKDFHRWLNGEISNSIVRRFEDPPEDFAMGHVRTPHGNYLVFNGEWSTPDQYLQDVLDALDTGPESLAPTRNAIRALLILSDEVARRCGYTRHTAGDIDAVDVTIPSDDEGLWQLCSSSKFDDRTIAQLGILPDDLEPFVLTLKGLRDDARQATIVRLKFKPILRLDDGSFVLVFPTSAPMAIVAFILDKLQQIGYVSAFGNALRKHQLRSVFKEATRGVSRGTSELHVLAQLQNVPRQLLSETAFQVDSDKYMHVIMLHDELDSACNDGIEAPWRPGAAETIARHIELSAAALASRSRYTGGLTIVVMAGIGRTYQIAAPKFLPEGWFLQNWASTDFSRLMWLEPNWQAILWKLSMQRSVLQQRGIEFTTPSDANLYAMWVHDNYHLVPSEVITSPHANIVVGCGYIFGLRRDARERIDEHSVYRPDRQRWLLVRRMAQRTYFKEDAYRQIYASLDQAEQGILEGVIESSERAWWVDCRTASEAVSQRPYIYKIWEVTLNWLERIAPTLDRMLPELTSGNIIIDLDLSAIANYEDWRSQAIKGIAPVDHFPIAVRQGKISIHVPLAFVGMGHDPQNKAERLLVRALVEGVVFLVGVGEPDQRVSAIVTELALRDEQRFMHAFETKGTRDFLREFDSVQATLLENVDIHFASVGISNESGLAVPTILTDKAECNAALNRIVDAFWVRCKERLKLIDRRALIRRCLLNNERILADHDDWRRTGRAVTALHADREDVLSASRLAKERRDRTQITHRIMVEMAVCACPASGGKDVSQGDIDYLGGQILLLIATAAQSDAVRSDAVTSSIRTSLAGDFRLENDLMEVMQPYLTSRFEQDHLRDISSYEEYFESSKRGTRHEEEVFGEAFLKAFRQEFGLSPARLAEVGTVLMEDVIAAKSTVIERSRKAFEGLLARNSFTSNEIEGLFKNFVLLSRPDWEKVAAPFRGKDWWPWRYRRRLSLMTRPIVAITESDFIYAPGFCEDSFRHVVMECFTGAFETEYFDSRAMKEYVGRENARRGLAFNKAVAKMFEDSGWKVRTEVAMTELGAPVDLASGDIDVFAWKNSEVYLCECKELLFARTITEVSEQLSRFRGNKGDDLSKHLRRVNWVKTNPNSIARVVGQLPSETQSLLITSKLVPMQYVTDFPVKIVSADHLAMIL